MRLLVLVVLAGVLLSPAAGAHHDSKWRWLKDHVPVYDRTHDMGDYVRIKVDEWNAAAGGAVTLDYVRATPDPNCADTGIHDGRITVCNRGGTVPCDGASSGCMRWHTKTTNDGDHKIVGVKIVLGAERWEPGMGEWGWPYGCHEIGHALGLNHDYGPDSCLGIDRDAPGSHDAEALRRLYR